MAVDHQIGRRRLDDDREDETQRAGFPQPSGEFETPEADSLILALGQDVDLSLVEYAPGIVIENGVVKVGPDMMTGPPACSPAATWPLRSAR